MAKFVDDLKNLRPNFTMTLAFQTPTMLDQIDVFIEEQIFAFYEQIRNTVLYWKLVDDVISATSSIWSSIVGVWKAKIIVKFGFQISKVIYKLRLSRCG